MKLTVISIRQNNDGINSNATLEAVDTKDRFSLSSKTLQKAGKAGFQWTEDLIGQTIDVDLSAYDMVAERNPDGRVYSRIILKDAFRAPITAENVGDIARRNGFAAGHFVTRTARPALAPLAPNANFNPLATPVAPKF